MMEITREDRRSVIDHCYLAYFISGMVILIFGRSAVVPGDRKLMFQPGLPGILRDDVPEDGCRGSRDPVSGLPAFIYIRTSGPGSLCDDLSHRYYKGNDHDHQ